MKANFPTPWCRDAVYVTRWLNNFYSHQPLIYTNKSDSHNCTAAKPLQINKLNIGILVLLFRMADPVWHTQVLCTNNNYMSCFAHFICIKYLSCADLESLQDTPQSAADRHVLFEQHYELITADTHRHTHNQILWLDTNDTTRVSNQRSKPESISNEFNIKGCANALYSAPIHRAFSDSSQFL